jgi:hypothetical protein
MDADHVITRSRLIGLPNEEGPPFDLCLQFSLFKSKLIGDREYGIPPITSHQAVIQIGTL